ncbi:hypothetical protein ccbrp13_15610 [Ktedonobacteria bacterium brp13]|nr:hypothetical protein ccbrp13_15610 [Ktedonobacteria bacterium brp13]
MAAEPRELTAYLKEDEIDLLQDKLDIAIKRLASKTSFRGRQERQWEITDIPERAELEARAQEVVKIAKTGVRIAPFVESRPLVPLFKAAKIDLPSIVRIDHEQMRYNFYCVESTFSILLAQDQFPLVAELDMLLIDDAKSAARSTRPLRLFPDRKDKHFFTADIEGEIGIDAQMAIAVPEMNIELPSLLQTHAKLAANTQLKANFVVGPLTFPFRRAAIEVVGESDQQIFWRYNLQSELTGVNLFKSVLILKVPQEVHSVRIEATLSVVPCSHRWVFFRDVLPKLSDTKLLVVELAST